MREMLRTLLFRIFSLGSLKCLAELVMLQGPPRKKEGRACGIVISVTSEILLSCSAEASYKVKTEPPESSW